MNALPPSSWGLREPYRPGRLVARRHKFMSTSTSPIEVESTRFYSAHHMLLRIAAEALTRAKKKEPGWSDHQFTAIALSALAVEALCNAVGARAVSGWQDYETCSPKAKLRVICTQLQVEYDGKREPWASIEWLAVLRNRIAHPKIERINQKKEVPDWPTSNQVHRLAPRSKLEKQMTETNARRAVDSVKQLVHALAAKLPPEQQIGITTDSWSTVSRAK